MKSIFLKRDPVLLETSPTFLKIYTNKALECFLVTLDENSLEIKSFENSKEAITPFILDSFYFVSKDDFEKAYEVLSKKIKTIINSNS